LFVRLAKIEHPQTTAGKNSISISDEPKPSIFSAGFQARSPVEEKNGQ